MWYEIFFTVERKYFPPQLKVWQGFSLQIMDKFNLNVYVQQITHESDCCIVDKWEENEELALNNVIDPNTEFKVIFY